MFLIIIDQITLLDLYQNLDSIQVFKNGTISDDSTKKLSLFALYKWDGGNTLNFHDFFKLLKLKPKIWSKGGRIIWN